MDGQERESKTCSESVFGETYETFSHFIVFFSENEKIPGGAVQYIQSTIQYRVQYICTILCVWHA